MRPHHRVGGHGGVHGVAHLARELRAANLGGEGRSLRSATMPDCGRHHRFSIVTGPGAYSPSGRHGSPGIAPPKLRASCLSIGMSPRGRQSTGRSCRNAAASQASPSAGPNGARFGTGRTNGSQGADRRAPPLPSSLPRDTLRRSTQRRLIARRTTNTGGESCHQLVGVALRLWVGFASDAGTGGSRRPASRPAQIILIRHAEKPTGLREPASLAGGRRKRAKRPRVLHQDRFGDDTISVCGRRVRDGRPRTTATGNEVRKTVAPLATDLKLARADRPTTERTMRPWPSWFFSNPSLTPEKTVVICWKP